MLWFCHSFVIKWLVLILKWLISKNPFARERPHFHEHAFRVGVDARDKAVDKNHTKARWRMHNWTLRHYVQQITNCLFHSINQKRSRIYHVTIFKDLCTTSRLKSFNLFIPVPFKIHNYSDFNPMKGSPTQRFSAFATKPPIANTLFRSASPVTKVSRQRVLPFWEIGNFQGYTVTGWAVVRNFVTVFGPSEKVEVDMTATSKVHVSAV